MKLITKSTRLNQLVILFIISLTFFGCSGQVAEKSKLLSLGQPPDNQNAVVFGQGEISKDAFEFAITFSPEMDEVFWTRRKPDTKNEIMNMQWVDGNWTDPKPAFFKAKEGWDFEPHIDPTGKRLYFGSTRPLPDSTKSNGLHQWYSGRKPNGWSDPIPLESPFIDKSVTMYLTSSEKGNLYFTTGETGDKPEDWVIYQSILQEGEYKRIERLGNEINFDAKYIAHSYIAPDESYLLYDAEAPTGFGESDLYISFNIDGRWSQAQNLGPTVNTDRTEMCPSVSPDGKYLFFHRGDRDKGDIYWIAFEPIKEQLKL